MKRVITAAALLLCASGPARAQFMVPQQMSFTAYLDDGGEPMTGPHVFHFALRRPDPPFQIMWEEEMVLDVKEGVVDTALGGAPQALAPVLGGSELLLEVSVDGVVLSPMIEVLSVPYAFRAGVAADAEKLGGLPLTSFVTSVLAGAGLSGGGTGTPTLSVAFAGSGAAQTVARSDHNHDGIYLRQGPTLSCMGPLSVVGLDPATGNVICGSGSGAVYTAGAGLSLVGTQFFIPTNGVTSLMIQDFSIGAEDMGGGSVGSFAIVDNSIEAIDINANAVGASEIAQDAVGSSEIAPNAVGASEIATSAVGADEIATSAVGSDEIAPGAVDTSELATGAVTGAKLASNAVNTGNLVDGAVSSAKLGANVCTMREVSLPMDSGSANAADPLTDSDGDGYVFPVSGTGPLPVNGKCLVHAHVTIEISSCLYTSMSMRLAKRVTTSGTPTITHIGPTATYNKDFTVDIGSVINGPFGRGTTVSTSTVTSVNAGEDVEFGCYASGNIGVAACDWHCAVSYICQ